ncbi:MAG: sulfite exporter TauE/SafE family protein [Hyphomicrobiaceae bacterium]
MWELIGVKPDAWLALVAAAVLLAGFLRGFVGFGAALISVPVLSLILGPHAAIAVSNVMGLPAVVQLLPEAIRRAERPVVLPICLAIFLATPIGTWLLVIADPGVMKIAISGVVLVMVAILASGWRLKGEVGMAKLLTAGLVGGLVQGAAGVGGPPVVAVALSRPGPAVQQRANVLALMTAISLSSIVPLLYYGLFTRQTVIIGLILVPLYSGATALGSRYFALGGQAHYRRAALATLAVIAVATLIGSVWSYLAS